MSAARRPAARRESTPSRASTAATWWSTVRIDTTSRAAISALVRPSATSASTSSWRVGEPGGVGAGVGDRAARHAGDAELPQPLAQPGRQRARAQPVGDVERADDRFGVAGRRERQRVPVGAALLLPVDRGGGPVLAEQRGVGLRDRAGERHRDAELHAPARQLTGGPRLADLGDPPEAVGGQRPRRRAVAGEPRVLDARGRSRADALDAARAQRPAPGLSSVAPASSCPRRACSRPTVISAGTVKIPDCSPRPQHRAGVLLGGLPLAEVEQVLAAHGEQVVPVGGHLVRVGVLQRVLVAASAWSWRKR